MNRRGCIKFVASNIVSISAGINISLANNSHIYSRHPGFSSGLYANTYLIKGENACALVDTHLTQAEALDLRELIDKSNLPLEAIFITHPHLDHIGGLQWLGPVFPDVPLFSSPAYLQEIANTALHWPRFDNPLMALTDDPIILAGHKFECTLLPEAESIGPAVLYRVEDKTLLSGDFVLNSQHHWLVEGRASAWIESLRDIKNVGRLKPFCLAMGRQAA